jgi:virginiamycin A acetyltransferase
MSPGAALGPDPEAVRPIESVPSIAFLRPLAAGRPNVEIGDYTYAHDAADPTRFFERSVRHHYPHMRDRLVIGRFCAIVEGAVFVMNGANHVAEGFSTYPFEIFGCGWETGFDPESWPRASRGDTVVGHDVWIGAEATILPGVRIGSGAIVGTRAVVGSEVPPYAVVAGNPARIVRIRHDEATVAALLRIAWWDWPVGRITRNLAAIRRADLRALEAAA